MPQPISCVQYLRRMRVADGGIVRFLLSYCQDLADEGHRVTVLTEDDVDVPAAWRTGDDGSPRVVSLRIPTRNRLWATSQPPAELIETIRTADVLHFHCLWDFNLRPLAEIARRNNLPYVLSMHGLLNDWAIRYKFFRKYVYWKLAGRSILNRAAFVHCTSDGERRQALPWLPRDNVRIVPLSLDKSAYHHLPGPASFEQRFPQLAGPEPMILVLGRLHPVKRIELLIDAVAVLRDGGLKAHLIVAGPAEVETYVAQLRQHITELNLQDFVHFVGTVDGMDKVSLYQTSDVFVLPSWQENFGMVLAESLAAETPIVTTRAVDTWSEFESAGGTIVEPTPVAIAAACRPLLEDRASAAELGRRGREFVFQWLDSHNVLERYVAMYSDAITSQASK